MMRRVILILLIFNILVDTGVSRELVPSRVCVKRTNEQGYIFAKNPRAGRSLSDSKKARRLCSLWLWAWLCVFRAANKAPEEKRN